jgi:uncharacterized membrane protein
LVLEAGLATKGMHMGKGRLEAFSDGVIAIIITIMVLELKPPHEHTLEAVKPLLPVLMSYVLSFIYVGIYWNNHHHLLHACQRVNGKVLWANLHLLFWLSLIPFTTNWMGESHFASYAVAGYGGVLLLSGFAYWILAQVLVKAHGKESVLARAIGKDKKGMVSVLLYTLGIVCTWVNPWVSVGIYVVVALIWLVPDLRIAKQLDGEAGEHH